MDDTDVTKLAWARRMARTGEGRRMREAAGLSGAEVAKAVGVDPTTIARWERGDSAPRTGPAIRWVDVLQQATAAAEGAVDSGAADAAATH